MIAQLIAINRVAIEAINRLDGGKRVQVPVPVYEMFKLQVQAYFSIKKNQALNKISPRHCHSSKL